MLSFKKEYQFIKNTYESKEFQQQKSTDFITLKSKPLVIYGAGRTGQLIADSLIKQGIEIECFCDKYQTGIIGEIPIISVATLQHQYSNANVLICSFAFQNEIKEELAELGITNVLPNSIVKTQFMDISEFENKYVDDYQYAFSKFEDDLSRKIVIDLIYCYLIDFPNTKYLDVSQNQYFDNDLIKLGENEVFVDIGMFVGDTAEVFFKLTDNKFKHYYGFEPDKNNFMIAQTNLHHNNITLINKGVYDTTSTLGFNSAGIASSINETYDSKDSIFVVSIDEFFSASEFIPTFIKCDSEGAELKILKGAAQTIHKHKPKLAFAVYHKFEDLYEIPRLLLSIRPDYKLYLRQYTSSYIDTVIYAL